MEIKPRRNYLVGFESVAMTDIILNMFIFFFISFSLIYTFSPANVSKIDVRLPKAPTAVALEGSEKVVVAITRQGEYFINDERIRAADLKKVLKARHRENPSLGLILKIDGASRFDSVVRALDVINELGIQKVSIAAVKKE